MRTKLLAANVAVFSDAARGWVRHRDARLGAALAYYSVFSIGPLLLIVVSVAGLLFGSGAAQRALSSRMQATLGQAGGHAVDAMLQGAGSRASGGLAAVAGVGLLLVAAVGVVVQLEDALETIWETEAVANAGWRTYLRTYLVSFAGIVALGLVLALLLVLDATLSYVSSHTGGGSLLVWHAVTFCVSLAVSAALFAMLFKWFPDAEVAWRHAIVGGATSALLFAIGKLAIGWYIGRLGLQSSYGAASSVVALLIWVYYSAQIVLYGAEVAHAAGIGGRL